MANSLNTTNPSRRAILTGIPAAAIGIGAISAPAMATLSEDAELIALREPLLEAWEAERELDRRSGISDKEMDAACDVTAAIVHKTEALRATTVEGLKVKALALSWTHSGHEINIFDDTAPTTDVRLIQSLVSDVLRLAGCQPFSELTI